MVAFNDFLKLLDSQLSGSWWFPALLIGTGIFFTIYLGFPQFRFFGQGWRIVSGKHGGEGSKGETTPFEALTTAMSGAVGTGNIGGVALAISDQLSIPVRFIGTGEAVDDLIPFDPESFIKALLK